MTRCACGCGREVLPNHRREARFASLACYHRSVDREKYVRMGRAGGVAKARMLAARAKDGAA